MPHKYHRMAASAALAFSILAIIAFQILSFYVPYVANIWAAEDVPLAGWQTVLILISEVTVTHRGTLMFTVLPVMFFTALLWHGTLWMLTLQAKRKQAFNGSRRA